MNNPTRPGTRPLSRKPRPQTGSKALAALAAAFLCLLPAFAGADAGSESLEKALALDRDGFYEDAAAAWETIIAAEPEKNILLLAHLKLSSTCLDIARLDQAVATAQAATRLAPASYDAYFHLANARSRQKDYTGSRTAFEKAVELRPGEGLGFIGLALSLFAGGDSAGALKTLADAKAVFKKKRNIQWYQDTRIMMQQIKGFAKYPPNFADLWLENNLRLVRETYEKTIFVDGPPLAGQNPPH